MRRALSTVWLASAVLAVFAAAADARTDDREKPVIFVHGFSDQSAVDCRDNFRRMKRKFRRWGHSGPLVTVAYYGGDRSCDHWLNHHGSHSKHYASGHQGKGHTRSTSIRHLGYHLAWFVWNHYTRHGRAVDVVAHSMGGLIVRYALTQTEGGHAKFPPRLAIEDVVTMGTPHGGIRWYGGACPYVQCDEMSMGSDFLNWLEDNGYEPDGFGGTDWSTFGSDDDNYVAADRAVGSSQDRDQHDYIASCHKVWYVTSNDIEHSDFLHDASKRRSADAYVYDCTRGTWVATSAAHWPVRRADLAVTFGRW
jgi:triacylglycerol esterase/lipase EstA (alpha/beta hydrolase family)